MEKQNKCTLKTLHFNNEKEDTSQLFGQFCSNFGLHLQQTILYFPQQNGMSERKNQMVMEIVICVLFAKKLLKDFHTNATINLLNRLSTMAIEAMTPFKA